MSILGIDIGGTKIKYGVVKSDGTVSHFSNIDFTTDVTASFLRIKDTTQGFKYKKVGICVAGDVDNKKGIVRFSPNLNWKNYDIRSAAEKVFKKPINVENDANAASFGAHVLDTKMRFKNLICITLGTGIGGGVIVDGKLYRGSTGSAGEIGHLTYIPEGIICSCGNSGCFERYIGRDGVIALAKRKIQSRNSQILKLINGDIDKITPEIVTVAALKNDRTAVEIWTEIGKILGVLLANLVNLLNPEVIVLTGGLSKAGKFLLVPAVAEMKKRAFKTPSEKVKVIISSHQEHLGVVGAAFLSKHTKV